VDKFLQDVAYQKLKLVDFSWSCRKKIKIGQFWHIMFIYL